MTTFVLLALLLVAMVMTWLAVRSLAQPWRILAAGIAFGTLSLILFRAGVSPLLTGNAVPSGPEGHWLRCVGDRMVGYRSAHGGDGRAAGIGA